MPTHVIHREITDASWTCGLDDGDGPNFTDEVASAIEAAGPRRCRARIWRLHNDAIETIDEEVAPGRRVRVGEFDGYPLPPWEGLPGAIRGALVALNDGEPPVGRQ